MSQTVAAPGYRCQICEEKMPLIDVPLPKFLWPSFIKVQCQNCRSHFMLKIKRVHGESKCVIAIVNCEPGELGKKLLTKRGKQLRNKVDEIETEVK